MSINAYPHRDEHQHQFLVDEFPDYDQSYVPIWGASWSDYSGFGWVIILDRDGELYKLENGYNPAWCAIGDSSEATWDPIPVTYEEAMEILIGWEELLE